MGITNAHFDTVVGDLVATLDKFKVPDKEKKELLSALGPMRKDAERYCGAIVCCYI